MAAMVQCENLNKSFGRLSAVNGISFSVDLGYVVGMLGPNGSGKTTTMRMIAGYLTPSDGRASVCGFDVAKFPIEVKKRIGYPRIFIECSDAGGASPLICNFGPIWTL